MSTIDRARRSGPGPDHDLTPAEQRTEEMLRHAALLGPAFTVRELCLVSGRTVTELLPSVRQAVADGILCDRGRTRLGFCDDVAREALRRDLPAAVGSELHRDLAERLAAEGAPATVVAEHLLGTTLGVRDLPWVEEVARDVQPQQPATAVALFERLTAGSIDLRDPRWFRAAAGQAEALLAAGRLAEAATAAEKALDRGAAHSSVSRLRRVVTTARLWQGQWRPARAHAVTFGTATDQLPSDRAEQLAAAATAAVLEGRSGIATHLCDRAEETARLAGAEGVLRQVIALRGHLAHRNGDLAGAARTLRGAARSAGSPQHRHGAPEVWSRAALALVLADLDRFTEARAEADEAAAEAHTWGWVPGATLALLVQARLLVDCGALDEAAALLDKGRGSSRGTGRVLGPLLDSERALVDLHRQGSTDVGDWEAVLGDDPAAVRALVGLGRRVAGRAKAHRLAGNEAQALRELTDGWASCAKAGLAPDVVRLGPEAADAARRTGNTALADEVRAALADLAGRNPEVSSWTAAATAAAALATGAPEALLEAGGAWRDSPRRLQAATALELVGATLREVAGHRGRGDEILQQAADDYRASGAAHDAARVRALLRGGPPPARALPQPEPADGSWEGLTRTERIVAGFVEQGATNAEIARRLVVSRRTVETHVSHILAKLELRSRADLILAAAQRDRGPNMPRSRTPHDSAW